GLLLALAEQQPAPEPELARDVGQPLLAHDLRAGDAEIALVRGREALHEPLADGECEDGVAEELEALVVFEALAVLVAVARVAEGALEQAHVTEAIPEDVFELAERRRLGHEPWYRGVSGSAARAFREIPRPREDRAGRHGRGLQGQDHRNR